MKKIFFLAAMLAAFTIAGSGQANPTDFSGTWELDSSKSKITAPSYIQSMALTVTQTQNELKVVTKMERGPIPAEAASGDGRGPGRRGAFGGGDHTAAYPLDGKEATVEIDGPNGKMPVKYKGTISGGKASLTQSRTFNGRMGEVSMTTKDLWSLSADGKTLTIERESTSPRGTNASTLVFVKK